MREALRWMREPPPWMKELKNRRKSPPNWPRLPLQVHQRRFYLIEFHPHPEEILAVVHIADLGQRHVGGDEGVGNDLDGDATVAHLLDKSHPSLAGHQVGRDHEHLALGFFKDSLKLLHHFG